MNTCPSQDDLTIQLNRARLYNTRPSYFGIDLEANHRHDLELEYCYGVLTTLKWLHGDGPPPFTSEHDPDT